MKSLNKRKQKIGLFGGTFNPIHYAHLKMAEAFYVQVKLEKLIFVPAGQPYHKHNDTNATAQDRFNMVQLAILGNQNFDISDCELMRVGDTYTVDTLLACKEKMDGEGEIWWLMGADSLLTLHDWFRYEDIFQLANIALVPRTGFKRELLHENIARLLKEGLHANLDEEVNHGKIQFLDMPLYNISSSQIRSLVAEGNDITECVPEKVAKYIEEHKLYI